MDLKKLEAELLRKGWEKTGRWVATDSKLNRKGVCGDFWNCFNDFLYKNGKALYSYARKVGGNYENYSMFEFQEVPVELLIQYDSAKEDLGVYLGVDLDEDPFKRENVMEEILQNIPINEVLAGNRKEYLQ